MLIGNNQLNITFNNINEIISPAYNRRSAL